MGVFLDTETNGLNPFKHCLLEVAFQIVDLGTGACRAEYVSVVAQPQQVWNISDPDSLKVNGFQWEEVQAGQPQHVVVAEIEGLLIDFHIVRGEAVFVCQNPSFDRPFFSQLISAERQEQLNWPYHWLDLASMFWAVAMRGYQKGQAALPWHSGYTKDKIAQAYGIALESQPHRALNGVRHLLECYTAVVGFPHTRCIG